MTQLVQTLIFGALLGGVYALMATGLTLTFGVMRIVNMAHGAFLILSAYLCYSLWSHFGIDPLAGAFMVTIPMAVIGVLLYKLVIERVQRIDPGLTIVATFALAIIAEAAVALAWGPNPTLTTPHYFNQSLHLNSLVVPSGQLYAFLLSLGVTVVLQTVVRRTWLGHAITAASENVEGARYRQYRVWRRRVELLVPVHPRLPGCVDRDHAQRGHSRRSGQHPRGAGRRPATWAG